MMEIFKAGVQYGDMKGTVAADHHDAFKMRDYLERKGLLRAGELIAGISVYSGEVHASRKDNEPIDVVVYAYHSEKYDNFRVAVDSKESLQLRRIELEMHPNDFLSLFKRFSIYLSPYGILEGKEFFSED